MKNIIKRFKSNKILFILTIITIISVIIGIFFLSIQSKDVKEHIYNSLNTIIKSINTNKYNNFNIFANSIKSNFIICILIWLLGISMIGIPLVIFVYVIKNIMLGFTISSFIYFYKIEGLFIGIIYVIPYIFNIIILFIMTYYAIDFSVLLFNYLFKNKFHDRGRVVKRYIKVLIVNFFLLSISSLFEGYLIPAILKLIFF